MRYWYAWRTKDGSLREPAALYRFPSPADRDVFLFEAYKSGISAFPISSHSPRVRRVLRVTRARAVDWPVVLPGE